jgi:hypothetical protein
VEIFEAATLEMLLEVNIKRTLRLKVLHMLQEASPVLHNSAT